MIALTFDTETINTSDISCFDIGMVARDLETGEIIDQLQLFPKEILDDKELLSKAYFYRKNKEVYEEVEGTPMKEVREQFNDFIMRNKPKIFSAFNIMFDIRVINFNFQKYTDKKNNSTIAGLSKRFRVIDIPLLFGLHSLVDNEDYRNFTILGNRVTKAGRAQTTAEAINCFIKKDQNAIEPHTGLGDAIIESEIIQYVRDNSDEEGFEFLSREASVLTKKNKKLWHMPEMKLL